MNVDPTSPAAKKAGRSTGPRTEGGKMRSKMNALKHGLTSKSLVVGAEDPQKFRRFARRLIKELQPRDSIEHEIALDVVMSAWRRRRSYQVESGVFSAEAPSELGIDPNDPRYEGLAFMRLSNDRDTITRLLRYEAAHRRSFYFAMKYLERRRRKADES
jgi:hypothetical protein